MDTNVPKVIVTDYYDSPVEGLIRSIDGKGFFFKLIAWDDQQDKRVFALKAIDTKIYKEIVNILEDSVKAGTWKPIWSFSDEQQDAKIKQLLHDCRFKSSIDFLLLGEHIDREVKIVVSNNEATEKALVLIANNKVDPMEGWYKLFDGVPEAKF